VIYELPDGRVEVRVDASGVPRVFVIDPQTDARRLAWLLALAASQAAHRLACRQAPSPFYVSAS
jgi:hypothetical protein